jgi:hypothetical protein
MFMLNQPAAAESAADYAAEDSLFHREVLNELIGLGSDLARMIHGQAKDQAAARYADEGVPDVTVAFERVCLTVRRTILLCRKVGEGPPERAAPRRDAERGREPGVAAGAAAGLRCELGDQLERPEVAEELAPRPVGAIVAEIGEALALCRGEIPDGAPGGGLPGPGWPSGVDDAGAAGDLAERLCRR